MKIIEVKDDYTIEVKDDYIAFDNGSKITFDHNQDCCEENYADFKKLCEFRHKWDNGWVCSKCGVRKADWIDADIKTTTREELL